MQESKTVIIKNADKALASLEAIYEYADEINSEVSCRVSDEIYQHLGVIKALIATMQEQLDNNKGEG